jgi:hypothetical protein
VDRVDIAMRIIFRFDFMQKTIAKIPFSLLVVICLTLGLAPFTPEPHLWEKLKMLTAGALRQPIDIFDLLLHGTPWILLLIKLYFTLVASDKDD